VVNNGLWRGPGSSADDSQGAVDHAALARSLGASGHRVSSRQELAAALDRAFEAARTGTPYVLDVICDPTVVSHLLRGLDQLGLM
jgi:thiamine pyrophosphate-dependent acetolactate synthase large subunit-like protein